MPTFEYALVILFWGSVLLALASILTPSAAFLCKKRTRIRGLASWLGIALVAGTLNMTVASTNILF